MVEDAWLWLKVGELLVNHGVSDGLWGFYGDWLVVQKMLKMMGY